ncbi:MAG: phosphate-starvation-inducible PsiE family protein [Burkholderiales bacterium]
MKFLLLRSRLISEQWPVLTYYQRFESVVALVLTLIVTLVILVALYRLSVEVVGGLVLGALNPLDHKVFQTVFGEIITLLIALEFNHTLQYVVTRVQSVIHIKVVLLIALLSLARKFIILDLKETTPDELLGLAAITLSLGITYWLLRERDDRRPRTPTGQRSPSTDEF